MNGNFKSGFIYQDALKPIAQVASDGTILSVSIYGTTSNSSDLIIKDGISYHVVHDYIGSSIYVVNSQTGQVAQKIVYDSWGNVTSDSNPGFQPFGFAGGLYDFATGLVRFGLRDYDASIGRWLNEDPIRFEGGSKLYAYVGNDPVNMIDPKGTDAQAVLINGFHSEVQVDNPNDGEQLVLEFGPKDGLPTVLAIPNLPVPSDIKIRPASQVEGVVFPIPFITSPSTKKAIAIF